MNAIREGSGLALRFPKFTGRLREEKSAEDATTVQEVIGLYKKQLKAIKEDTFVSEQP
jgi:DNA ligase-1